MKQLKIMKYTLLLLTSIFVISCDDSDSYNIENELNHPESEVTEVVDSSNIGETKSIVFLEDVQTSLQGTTLNPVNIFVDDIPILKGKTPTRIEIQIDNSYVKIGGKTLQISGFEEKLYYSSEEFYKNDIITLNAIPGEVIGDNITIFFEDINFPTTGIYGGVVNPSGLYLTFKIYYEE